MSSLRTHSWGPVDGAPRISIGIGPRNGRVMLGTRLESETNPQKLEAASRRWKFLCCGGFSTYILVKLLHGPWTKDRLYFLQALIEAHAYLDQANETHVQMVKQGLTEAIREDNYRAVDLLISEAMGSQYSQFHQDNYFVPSFVTAKFVMEVCEGSRVCIGNLKTRRALGIMPDTEHLKVAVIERGCRRMIVKRLLRAKYSRISLTDPALVRWAERKKEEGDGNGQWLLDQLTELRDRELRDSEGVFRRLDWS